MRLNADFLERASAHARDMPGSPPSAGVDCKCLTASVMRARATSIVRFARGSAAPHDHGGEEFRLEGTFKMNTAITLPEPTCATRYRTHASFG